jgi:transcription initiation factor TFIIB
LQHKSENSYERERYNNIKQCPECGGEKIIRDYDVAEIVCVNCGNVIAEKLVDQKPEWRVFDDEQSRKRIRVGSPLTYTIHDKGLSTIINRRDAGSTIGTQTSTQGTTAYKLRRWQNRAAVSNTTQRNLVAALSELSKLASSLHLPKKVVETAAIIYRKTVQKNLVKGRSTQYLAAAAIYIGCRQCDIPRSLEEVSNTANLYKMNVGRTSKFIMRKLGMSVLPSKSEKVCR